MSNVQLSEASGATNDPMQMLSKLDEERLVASLLSEDIRLVRREWLLAQPDSYRLQRRQELEMLEQAGASPLLSGEEAVSLIRNAKREVGVLS